MNIIFKEYSRVVWQKKWFFLLALFALASAMTLDLSAPIYYKNIANGLAAPYSDATLALMLDNLKQVAIIYAGIWLSWRLLEMLLFHSMAAALICWKSAVSRYLKNKNTFFSKTVFPAA